MPLSGEGFKLPSAHVLGPTTMKLLVYSKREAVLSTCRTQKSATLGYLCTVGLDFHFVAPRLTSIFEFRVQARSAWCRRVGLFGLIAFAKHAHALATSNL